MNLAEVSMLVFHKQASKIVGFRNEVFAVLGSYVLFVESVLEHDYTYRGHR